MDIDLKGFSAANNVEQQQRTMVANISAAFDIFREIYGSDDHAALIAALAGQLAADNPLAWERIVQFINETNPEENQH